MKTICIAIVSTLSLIVASQSDAQKSDDPKTVAKAWLSATCHHDDLAPEDLATFARHKAALKAYFLSAIYRQLEVTEMRDEEAALARIYDENLKRLNESKPAWVTPEIETRLRSTSREAYISEGRERLAASYKARALDGLKVLDSLSAQ